MTQMRGRAIASIVFFCLAGLSLVGAVMLYGYIAAMACAFGAPNGGCRTPLPWELNGEDFTLMVVIPGIIVAVFAGLGFILRPR